MLFCKPFLVALHSMRGSSDNVKRYVRRAPMSHLSFPTWFASLLDLSPFHWHAILVGGDELDGSFLWGLCHG